MSIILSSILIGAGSALIGRFIVKRRAEAAQRASDAENESKKEEKKEPAIDADEAKAAAEVEAEVPTAKDESAPRLEPEVKKPKAKAKPASGVQQRLEGFLCQLGDVLTRVTGEEAWLAGGVVLSEEIPVAVLFVAPDAGQDCAIYVRPHPRSSLFWLEPLDPAAVLVGGEPPSSVEHAGVRFDRARRLPLRPRRIGVGAPDVGDGVLVAEYASAGAERLLVLKSNSGDVRAYRGLELEEGTYEVIASGESTL
ncbi:MAG: hypothetical protein KIT84_26890 [Labilithrix sp.]|nr:hypothetical protein [Labilithrix sp.]MCW5814682.1 hypothetical protein [Labilithrix sp.]